MRQGRGDIKRQTSRGVYLWDRAASAVISIGGVVVLVAVLGICVYLLWEVLPLFKGGQATAQAEQSIAAPTAVSSDPVLAVLGEYSQGALVVDRSGSMSAVALHSGKEFWRSSLGDGKAITAASRPEHEGLIALGLSDGSIRIGRFSLLSRLLRDDELTPAFQALDVGQELIVGEGTEGRLIERARTDQYRETTASIQGHESLPPGAVMTTRVDLRENPAGGRFIVRFCSDGAAYFGTVRTITPLGGGEATDKVTSTSFAINTSGRGPPDWLFVTADGRHVLALWKSGTLERYATGLGSDAGIAVSLAESIAVAPGSQVTSAGMLLGGQTLVVGDASGMVRAYNTARDVTSTAPDAMRLVMSGEFRNGSKAVRGLVMAERDRIVAAADEAGDIVIREMTSRKTIAKVAAHSASAAPILAITPKSDALFYMSQGHSQMWSLSLGHSDASVASLFTPIMYEGEAKPQYIYQSSSGSDAAEVKLSLIPLIFGTLKATVVGMLVAVPLAVLGAIYSSEFMHKRVRKVVKPTVELMASLPSVVLGFIAAMIVAPFIQEWLPRVLVGILLAPVFLVFFAYLWQLVPRDAALKVTRRARMLLVGVALLASALLAMGLGPSVERTLFGPTHTDMLVSAGSFEPVAKDQWPAWVGQRQTMSADEERQLRHAGMYFRQGQVVRPVEAAVSPTAAGEPGIQRWLDGSIGGATPGWLAALFLPVLLLLSFVQARVIDRERFEQILGTSRLAMAGR